MKEFNPNQSMEAFIATCSGSARDQVLNQKKRKARRVESDRQSNAPLILVWVRIPADLGSGIAHFLCGPAGGRPALEFMSRYNILAPLATNLTRNFVGIERLR